MAQDHRSDSEFLDKLYSVALEPERFDELVECWSERLSSATQGTAMPAPIHNLSEHVRRAESLIDLTESQKANLPASISRRLNAEAHAAFAYDKHGVIRGANDSAAAIYGVAEGQQLAALPFDEDTQRSLARFASRRSDVDEADRGPEILRAWRTDTERSVILSLNGWTTASGRRLAVAKSVEFNWPESLRKPIQDAFELTDAEMEVMQLLAEGNGAPAIAEQRGASIATVRAQIRSIYDKTETHSLNEFMRMALGLTSLGLVDAQGASGVFDATAALPQPPYPRAEHRRLLTLPDARTLEYALFGAPDGPVLLFMQDEFFGDGWVARMGARAEAEGIRVLAPSRPGNGRSSPYPRGSVTYEQATADLLFLLDRLEIKRVVVRCFMAGANFAFAFAKAAPERLSGLLVQAPILPLGDGGDDRRLNRFHKLLGNVIHRSPGLLNFVTRAGMAYHNRVGTKRFFKSFAEGRAADLAALDDPDTFAAMLHGAQLCGAQGHVGFYSDYRDVMPDMGATFAAIDAPITVLVGENSLPKIDPALLARARRHERCKVVMVPGGDHYLHFTHPDAVMDAMLDLLKPNSPRKVDPSTV